MCDLDILHEIEKELGIKFTEISKEEWEKHIENGTSYSRNEYYIENENILLISFRNISNISQKVWDLKFLSELYFSESSFDNVATDIRKLDSQSGENGH